MTLGEQIKYMRQQQGLSQPELAEKSGIEQSYLSKLENNKSIPSNEMLRKLLIGLNTELAVFLSAFDNSYIRSKLKVIPDVDQWLEQQHANHFKQSRLYLWLASALIVLATTIFFIGYSKLVFTEIRYEYFSHGLIKQGEVNDVYRNWPRLLDKKSPNYEKEYNDKRIEMLKRQEPKYVLLSDYKGESFIKNIGNDTRRYQYVTQRSANTSINGWLQVLGVMLFSMGTMLFVLESKFKKFS